MNYFFSTLIIFYIANPETCQLFPFAKEEYNPKPFVKCFEQIGCIEVNEKWYDSVHRPVNLEPLDRYLIKTDFIILKYNASFEDKLFFDKVLPKRDSVLEAGIKRSDTVIIIHDFTSSGYTGWVKHLARVIMRKGNTNILSVDWQKGAEPPLDQALANARVVALEIAFMISILSKEVGIDLHDIHLIGHGVGAHIAAYVGHVHRNLQKITGLDPTGPRFQGMPDIVHLNPNSAKYVEVLHTDSFDYRSQGTAEKWGHADYFINNDELQPGCVEYKNYSTLTTVDRDALNQGDILPGCSHKRAFKYYIEALEKPKCVFLGIQCSNFENFEKGLCVSCDGKEDPNQCISFGSKENPVPVNHSYYLNTYSSSPFCMNPYAITVALSPEEKSQTGYFDIILVDYQNNVANTSLVDPESQIRTFSTSSNNTYLYYAGGPKLGAIKEAKVKWTVKGNIMCFLMCKKSIHVKQIIVKLLIETHAKEKAPVSRLCPLDPQGAILSGTYANYHNCQNKSVKDKTET